MIRSCYYFLFNSTQKEEDDINNLKIELENTYERKVSKFLKMQDELDEISHDLTANIISSVIKQLELEDDELELCQVREVLIDNHEINNNITEEFCSIEDVEPYPFAILSITEQPEVSICYTKKLKSFVVDRPEKNDLKELIQKMVKIFNPPDDRKIKLNLPDFLTISRDHVMHNLIQQKFKVLSGNESNSLLDYENIPLPREDANLVFLGPRGCGKSTILRKIWHSPPVLWRNEFPVRIWLPENAQSFLDALSNTSLDDNTFKKKDILSALKFQDLNIKILIIVDNLDPEIIGNFLLDLNECRNIFFVVSIKFKNFTVNQSSWNPFDFLMEISPKQIQIPFSSIFLGFAPQEDVCMQKLLPGGSVLIPNGCLNISMAIICFHGQIEPNFSPNDDPEQRLIKFIQSLSETIEEIRYSKDDQHSIISLVLRASLNIKYAPFSAYIMAKEQVKNILNGSDRVLLTEGFLGEMVQFWINRIFNEQLPKTLSLTENNQGFSQENLRTREDLNNSFSSSSMPSLRREIEGLKYTFDSCNFEFNRNSYYQVLNDTSIVHIYLNLRKFFGLVTEENSLTIADILEELWENFLRNVRNDLNSTPVHIYLDIIHPQVTSKCPFDIKKIFETISDKLFEKSSFRIQLLTINIEMGKNDSTVLDNSIAIKSNEKFCAILACVLEYLSHWINLNKETLMSFSLKGELLITQKNTSSNGFSSILLLKAFNRTLMECRNLHSLEIGIGFCDEDTVDLETSEFCNSLTRIMFDRPLTNLAFSLHGNNASSFTKLVCNRLPSCMLAVTSELRSTRHLETLSLEFPEVFTKISSVQTLIQTIDQCNHLKKLKLIFMKTDESQNFENGPECRIIEELLSGLNCSIICQNNLTSVTLFLPFLRRKSFFSKLLSLIKSISILNCRLVQCRLGNTNKIDGNFLEVLLNELTLWQEQDHYSQNKFAITEFELQLRNIEFGKKENELIKQIQEISQRIQTASIEIIF